MDLRIYHDGCRVSADLLRIESCCVQLLHESVVIADLKSGVLSLLFVSCREVCDDSRKLDARELRELLVLLNCIVALFISENSESDTAHSCVKCEEALYRLSALSHYFIAQSLDVVIMHYDRSQVILDDCVDTLCRSQAENYDAALDAVLTEIDAFLESSNGKMIYSVVFEDFGALSRAVSVSVSLDDADHVRALHLALDLLDIMVKGRHIDLCPYLSQCFLIHSKSPYSLNRPHCFRMTGPV